MIFLNFSHLLGIIKGIEVQTLPLGIDSQITFRIEVCRFVKQNFEHIQIYRWSNKQLADWMKCAGRI